MKNFSIFLAASMVIVIFGCTQKTNYIIPADLSRSEDEVTARLKTHGLTQEEMNGIMEGQMKEVMNNTVGKTMPDVFVRSLAGKVVNLKSLIKVKTLLNFTDAHCGAGAESTIGTLPGVLKKLKQENININTILILVKTPDDSANIARFSRFIEECKPLYSNIYIIEEDISLKINIIGSPARLIIGNDHKVLHLNFGSNTQETLYTTLRESLKK